jgi:hypothetical protein
MTRLAAWLGCRGRRRCQPKLMLPTESPLLPKCAKWDCMAFILMP